MNTENVVSNVTRRLEAMDAERMSLLDGLDKTLIELKAREDEVRAARRAVLAEMGKRVHYPKKRPAQSGMTAGT